MLNYEGAVRDAPSVEVKVAWKRSSRALMYRPWLKGFQERLNVAAHFDQLVKYEVRITYPFTVLSDLVGKCQIFHLFGVPSSLAFEIDTGMGLTPMAQSVPPAMCGAS